MAKKILYVLGLLLFTTYIANAQQGVGIGTTNANTSAMLDIASTQKGLLPPRMSAVQRLAIGTPANGLLVYDTDSSAFMIRANNVWTRLMFTNTDLIWKKDGNDIYSGNSGFVGIGNTSPSYNLHVTSATTQSRIATETQSNTSFASIRVLSPGGIADYLRYGNGATGALAGVNLGNLARLWNTAGALLIGNDNTEPVYFATNGSVKARLTSNGNFGIGVDPTAKLDIAGNIKIADGTQGLNKVLTSDADGLASWQAASGFTLPYTGSTASSNGLSITNSSSFATAILGTSTNTSGTNTGVFGNIDGQGWGVRGMATATTGAADGVYGSTMSTYSAGIKGYAIASSGENYGVYGVSNSTDGFGGYFRSITGGTALKTDNGAVQFSSLEGTGNRMVVANANGVLSTQAIPSGGALTLPYSGNVSTGDAFTLLNSGSGAAIAAYNTGTGTAGFFSNSSATGKALIVASGYTGLGIQIPAAPVHAYSTSTFSIPNVLIEQQGSDYSRLKFKNSVNTNSWVQAALVTATPANDRLNFYHSTGGDVLQLTGDGKTIINGPLAPSGNAGTAGKVLQSTGPTTAPVWGSGTNSMYTSTFSTAIPQIEVYYNNGGIYTTPEYKFTPTQNIVSTGNSKLVLSLYLPTSGDVFGSVYVFIDNVKVTNKEVYFIASQYSYTRNYIIPITNGNHTVDFRVTTTAKSGIGTTSLSPSGSGEFNGYLITE